MVLHCILLFLTFVPSLLLLCLLLVTLQVTHNSESRLKSDPFLNEMYMKTCYVKMKNCRDRLLYDVKQSYSER